MAKVALTGGYYVAPSLIAGAARCLNLYPEKQPEGATAPYLDRPTPGLRTLATPTAAPARGLFTASSGDLYAFVGSSVYYVDPTWGYNLIGTIATSVGTVTASDNGSEMLIADGSPTGYWVDLTTRLMTTIGAAQNFYGAVRLDEMDTYFVGNIPGTRTFFSSDLNSVTFDPLYVANKSGASDKLVSVVVVNREIWLMGASSCEIWFNAGGADFPFQIMAGPFIQYGVAASGSVARQGASIFWLAQDQFGGRTVMQGKGYAAEHISTPAIDDAIRKYGTYSDAIGFCYQQAGHQFYMLTFPTADKTWCYDATAGLWHERAWIDADGNERRHRASCAAYAYGVNVIGDWQTGALYALDLEALDDAGAPIVRRRGFPTMQDDGDRVSYSQMILQIAVGYSIGTTPAKDPDNLLIAPGLTFDLVAGPADPGTAPQVFLRWSDDGGVTWGTPVGNSMGASGQYITSVQWQRLGISRNRVFEVFWSEPVKTAIQGAFITSKKLGS